MKANYEGTPENYLNIPKSKEIDIDALTCALHRANAVSKMLGANFDGSGETFNKSILANACWALDGLIEQAQIIVEGKR